MMGIKYIYTKEKQKCNDKTGDYLTYYNNITKILSVQFRYIMEKQDTD